MPLKMNGNNGDNAGDDLGANDELIAFKDEGEQEEEKRNVSAERDLDDVKSSLVNESEINSSSDSEQDRRPRTNPDLESRARQQSLLFEEALRRRQQDGSLFQPSPYVGYPFFMIPDLGNFCSPYLTNQSARGYLPFQWPLLDVPGRSTMRDSTTPTHLSNNMVQHPHMSQFHPLLYSPEAFSPQRASPGFSPDAAAGMSRTPHSACYPVSPGGMTQIPHPLGWLQPQSMYPMAGGFSPAALAMNASMSSLVSGGFSPRLAPPQSIPHPAIVSTNIKQEPGSSSSQHGRAVCDDHHEKEEEKKPHIKKPLNAFMLYMREERPQVVAQCKVKESATINQILGQRWHSLTKEEQSKYYELARKERLLHSKLYPGWSARDNYGKKKKRKRTKSETQSEAPEEDFPLQLKRPRVPEDPPHTHTQTAHTHSHTHSQPSHTHSQPSHTHSQASHTHSQPSHTHSQASHTHAHSQNTHHNTQPPPRSHFSHTHLSQASPASSLDSPATPTTALASPGAPAPTHTDHAHTYTHTEHTHTEHTHTEDTHTHSEHEQISPYAEQLQPLSLTTKPHRTSLAMNRHNNNANPGPSFLVPPPNSAIHQSGAGSHGALSFAHRRTNQL